MYLVETTQQSDTESDEEKCKKLIKSIFTKYATHLAKIGYVKLAKEYEEILEKKYGCKISVEEIISQQSTLTRSDSWTIIK